MRLWVSFISSRGRSEGFAFWRLISLYEKLLVLFFRKKEPWFDLLSLIHVLQLTNQNLVAQKTHLLVLSFFDNLVCFLACSGFIFCFFHVLFPNESCQCMKPITRVVQTILSDMIFPIRDDFEHQFKSPSGDLGVNLNA